MVSELETIKQYQKWRKDNTNKVCLLKFGSETCPPCRKLAPLINAIAEKETNTISCRSVNIRKSPELSKKFSVQRIPLCIIFPLSTPVADPTPEEKKPILPVALTGGAEFGKSQYESIIPDEKEKEKYTSILGYKPDEIVSVLKSYQTN